MAFAVVGSCIVDDPFVLQDRSAGCVAAGALFAVVDLCCVSEFNGNDFESVKLAFSFLDSSIII